MKKRDAKKAEPARPARKRAASESKRLDIKLNTYMGFVEDSLRGMLGREMRRTRMVCMDWQPMRDGRRWLQPADAKTKADAKAAWAATKRAASWDSKKAANAKAAVDKKWAVDNKKKADTKEAWDKKASWDAKKATNMKKAEEAKKAW